MPLSRPRVPAGVSPGAREPRRFRLLRAPGRVWPRAQWRAGPTCGKMQKARAGASSRTPRGAGLGGAQGRGGRRNAREGLRVSDQETPTMGAKDSPDAIYDARKLGAPKMAIFGLQHMFAMFGATILVPVADGSARLRDAAVRGRGHAAVPLPVEAVRCRHFWAHRSPLLPVMPPSRPTARPSLLPYACLGVACAGSAVSGAGGALPARSAPSASCVSSRRW